MKNIVAFCICLFLVVGSCIEKTQKEMVVYKYQEYIPPEYGADPDRKWPLIIFLHGASLRGDDLEKIKKFGIPRLIDEGRDFDFVIVSPQLPEYEDWSSDDRFPLTFEEVKHKFRIDTNRIYLTGMSLGGEGAWYIAEQFPDVFAAIAPVCGRISEIESIKKEVDKISDIPTWIFHGAKDNVYSIEESDEMYKLLHELNPEVKYTRYKELNHGATHDVTYKNDTLYQWFLAHQKSG